MTSPPNNQSSSLSKRPILGVVGGGQLARMMVPAATELDIELRLMVEEYGGSAASVWKNSFVGNPKNIDDLRRLTYGLDGKDVEKTNAVTFEHEHIPQENIIQLEKEGFTVTPSSSALLFAQNKLEMRKKMAELKIDQPENAEVKTEEEIMNFVSKHGECVLKTATGGYDGKGVWFIESQKDIPPLEKSVCYLVEKKIEFVREVSQLVVRSINGEVKTYDLAESRQENGVCKTVIAPAPQIQGANTAKATETAEKIAKEIAESIGIVGILAVEMFEDKSGNLLINELAMRPHNTGHWTINGAVTSQFENHLRACLGLPLGSTNRTSEVVVMENILGSNLSSLSEKISEVAVIDPRLKINLYGKGIRPERKLGHVNLCGKMDELPELLELAKKAADIFENKTEEK